MRALCLIALLLSVSGTSAHSLSDAELHLSIADTQLEAQLSLRLDDLAAALPLDADADRLLRWREVLDARPLIDRYVLQRLTISSSQGACPLSLADMKLRDYRTTTALWLRYHSDCAGLDTGLSLNYALLFDFDPSHRGIISLSAASLSASTVVAPGHQEWSWSPRQASWPGTLRSYFASGVEHIWIGLDHLLLLVVLLLPIMLDDARRRKTPRRVALDLFTLISSFTVAHSLTLMAATLGWLTPPIVWVEVLIAASVVFAAMNNLFEWLTRRTLLIVFGFGLLHGFGFASVLADFGLPSQTLGVALLGFNLGVEAGQLLFVGLLAPLLFAAARLSRYQLAVVQLGSLLAAIVAMVWIVERTPLPFS